MRNLSKWAICGVAVIVLALVGVACGSTGSTSSTGSGVSQNDAQLSAGTTAYLATAMPAMQKIMADWRSEKYTAAGKLWKSIGDIPEATSADQVMGDAYLKYANNVRYYMVGDGSANLKDVEDSKTKAQDTLAGFQSP